MSINVKPLAAGFGGEIDGLDIRNLDAAMFDELRHLWLAHEVLLMRGQSLEEEDLVAFSRRFGDLEIHVRREYLSAEHPEILYVSNIRKGGRAIGILSDHEVGWHYDQIYLGRPAVGSCLYAVKLPKQGGSTWFADMAGAYDALPAAMKARLDGKHAVQSYEHFNRGYSVPTNDEQKKRTPDVVHPLVRTHPITGRKALYICPGMTTRIVELPEAESAALLEELFAWSVRPEFTYRHDWRYGDALLWDNACTMHRRDPFDGDSERLMKRTTILPPADLAVPF